MCLLQRLLGTIAHSSNRSIIAARFALAVTRQAFVASLHEAHRTANILALGNHLTLRHFCNWMLAAHAFQDNADLVLF
jgi:hypothetical protein